MSSARDLLVERVNEYKKLTFLELVERMNDSSTQVQSFEATDDAGKTCLIEISIEWEEKQRSVRVIGFIDMDRPWWRRFVSTISDSFAMNDKNQLIE